MDIGMLNSCFYNIFFPDIDQFGRFTKAFLIFLPLKPSLLVDIYKNPAFHPFANTEDVYFRLEVLFFSNIPFSLLDGLLFLFSFFRDKRQGQGWSHTHK